MKFWAFFVNVLKIVLHTKCRIMSKNVHHFGIIISGLKKIGFQSVSWAWIEFVGLECGTEQFFLIFLRLDGDLGYYGNVISAYMKQKHRMVWERRHGKIGSGRKPDEDEVAENWWKTNKKEWNVHVLKQSHDASSSALDN